MRKSRLSVIVEARLKAGTLARGAALLLLIDLVAVARRQLVELDGEALAHRTDAGIPDARHGLLLWGGLRTLKML